MEERTGFVKRLEPIFQDILHPKMTLTEEISPATVEEWDSINHLSLVVAIEDEFGVTFDVESLAKIRSVSDIVDALIASGCKASA
jgi:acyl carrier protein